MKGVFFVELLKMAEDRLGEAQVDIILNNLRLPSGGAYTTVQRFPREEYERLLKALARALGETRAQLSYRFGRWMFCYFASLHPDFVAQHTSTYSLLSDLEEKVHAQIRKLDDQADIPQMEVEKRSGHEYILLYRSTRKMIDFCQGSLEASLDHFREKAELTREVIETPLERIVLFRIKLRERVMDTTL